MPVVSSRTPEGDPLRCVLCGGVAALETSFPGGDAVCPQCGHLLWWFRDRLNDRVRQEAGLSLDEILSGINFAKLGLDSLDVVELVMELEEEFDIQIPASDAEKIQTVLDAIRYILKHKRDHEE